MQRLDPAVAANPAPIFAALGDPTRLGLLACLADGESRSIIGLSAGSALTRQAITKHLIVLESAGLVSRVRAGRESRYALRPEPIVEARDYLQAVSAQWADALERLRAFVESPAAD